MFYSETLLSKTGPLARVWLSANLERKLSKTHILQSNIETSVNAIVGQDQAPMALRLSGQLLLGVVRIYSRKARYLYDDCNEALMKIKMAFRPGNVDLPSGTTAHSAAQLTLPDVITELDLLLPDPSSLLADLGDLNLDGGNNISRRRDIMIDDTSFLQESVETGRVSDPRQDMSDDILQLDDDLELDIGEPSYTEEKRSTRIAAKDRDMQIDDNESIEMGRDRPPSRALSEEFLSRDDFQLDRDITMGGTSPELDLQKQPPQHVPQLEEDLNLDDEDFGGGGKIDWQAAIGEEISDMDVRANITVDTLRLRDLEGLHSPDHAEEREDTSSPLSSARSSVVRDLEEELYKPTANEEQTRLPSEDPEQAAASHQRQARKRKVVVDSVTEIRAKQIKSQQEDRSRILKEPSFLPRDPGVLALVTLQRTGGFATSVFYPKNIHPDLAGMLSPEFVKRMAAMKRKREEEAQVEGVEGVDMAGKESPAKRIQLDLGDESMIEKELAAGDAAAAAARLGSPEEDEHGDEGGELINFPQDTSMRIDMDDGFDVHAGDTTIHTTRSRTGTAELAERKEAEEEEEHDEDEGLPIPPASTGPVTQQTIRAVHLLRSEFEKAGVSSTPSTDSRRQSALNREQRKFQDLLPPETTSRVDATKMFFEVLVLATKDAVRVRQEKEKAFGGDIWITPKRGLWGRWAEERDEQQVAEEEERRRDEEEREKERSRIAEKRREKEKGRMVDVQIRGGQRAVEEGIAAA
ncbi:Rec8 like protein-domain-containing protein [Kalaharituber pfeilii]|nr:Rec8 like protein-domain-containing protein [Kalaharituber pfeilii]